MSGIHGLMYSFTLVLESLVRLITGFNDFFISFIERKAESGRAKHSGPGVRVKIRKFIRRGSNCCKPIIKNDIELGRDGTSGRIEDKRNGGCMAWRETNVDGADGVRQAAGNLLSIGNCFVENIHGTSKDVNIMK